LIPHIWHIRIMTTGSDGLQFAEKNGGPCWIRTNDHLIKSQMLYRLS